MKKWVTLSIISGLGLTSMAMANTVNLHVDVGMAFSHLSNNATVTPVNGVIKSYTANEGTQSALFTGIGSEYVFDPVTSTPFTLGVGLAAYYVGLGNISGTEVPGTNMGLTDSLDYSMKAHSTVILLEPRVIYTAYHLQPYLLTGVGYAWNTLNNFTETTPTGSHAAPSEPYSGHTEGSFAYEVGAGVQYPLTVKQNTVLVFHLGYRYLYLGNAELGTAPGQTTSERLGSKHISTNIVDIGFSYPF